MTSRLRLTFASLLAACALGAIAPAAQADLYWAGDFQKIGRSSIDGFDVDPTFVSGGSPAWVALDKNFVYWTNLGGNLGRANKDASGSPDQSFILPNDPGSEYPEGISVRAGTVFWANLLTDAIFTASATSGGAGQSLSPFSPPAPMGIATDDSHIYWANQSDQTIGRANLDGSNSQPQWISGITYPYGVAVDGKYIYWSNHSGDGTNDSIGRAKLNGTGVQDDFIDLSVTSGSGPGVEGVAVDGNYIYWGDFNNGAIGRARLNGTGVEDEFLSPQETAVTGVVGVAVDPSPSISLVGKATKRSLKLKLGCGRTEVCSLRVIGNKAGTKAPIKPKTVTTDASGYKVTKLAYTPRLRKALAKGGRIELTATNPATDGYRSIVVRVAK